MEKKVRERLMREKQKVTVAGGVKGRTKARERKERGREGWH